MTGAEKEQIKNHASMLNSVAANIFAAGVIGPVVAYIFDGSKYDVWALVGVGVLCLLITWVIHMVGDDMLGEIV